MKHFLITYKKPDLGYIVGREMEIIEAQSESQAHANAWQKAKTSKWEFVSLKLIAPDKVDLERKRLKDRRKLRYQSTSY